MKKKIHPKYVECKVTCGCGETFVTRATRAEINVEICSKCHPFYTGKQKLVDTAGRVEKFQRRYAKFQEQQQEQEEQEKGQQAQEQQEEEQQEQQDKAAQEAVPEGAESTAESPTPQT